MKKRIDPCAMLFGFALASAAWAGAGPSFQDDFESGLFNVDGGVEVQVLGAGADTTVDLPGAAHRGTFGLRAHDANVLGVGAGGDLAGVRFSDAGTWDGTYFVRGWFRLSAVQDAGSITIIQVDNANGGPVLSVRLLATPNSDAGQIWSSGFDEVAPGNYLEEDGGGFDTQAWHLLEARADGIGSLAGTRLLFIDGLLISQSGTLHWGSAAANAVSVGIPFAVKGPFVGTVDWDDVRGSPVPPASTLYFANPVTGAVPVGACQPFTVSLESSFGGPALAPYPVSLDIEVSGLDAGLFFGPGCINDAGSPAIAFNGIGYSGSLLPYEPGRASLVATNPDFLSVATTTFKVSPAQDAGTGADGGPAGPPGDGGSPVGGGAQVADLGCGCGALGVSAMAWACLAALAASLRLRGRRIIAR